MADKRKAVLVRRIGKVIHFIGKPVTITASAKSVTFLGKPKKTFTVDMERPFFRRKNAYWYLFEVIDGQLSESKFTEHYSSEFNNKFVAQKTIEQILARAERPLLYDYLPYIFLTALGCVPIGYILGVMFPMG